MSDELENNDTTKQVTVYGAIGIAIFFIFAGVVYAFPNTFPEGTLYLVAGVLIALVSILNTFKGIGCDVFNVTLVATGFILIGVIKIFSLEIKFWPAVLIVVGIAGLLVNINRLRGGRK
ncbi:hypothetical protein ACTXMH_12210 [Psychrobacter celer]